MTRSSKHRTVIFEGPNRVGKTTLIEEVVKILPVARDMRIKGTSSISSRAALEDAWNQLYNITNYSKSLDGKVNTLIDRFPLFSDPIYRPIIEGKPNIDFPKHEIHMLRELADLNTVVIYIMAPVEVIEARFKQMGNHYHAGGTENIAAVHHSYAREIDKYLNQQQSRSILELDDGSIPKFMHFINDGNETPAALAKIIAHRLQEHFKALPVGEY